MTSGAPDFWVKGKYVDLVELINRIALIDEVSLIDLITKISEITNVKLVDLITKISEITTIKHITDITFSPKGLIQNPSFESDFAGWFHSVTPPTIETATPAKVGEKYLKFPSYSNTWVDQTLGIAIDPSWFTSLKFYLRSPNINMDALQFYYYDIDDAYFTQIFQVTAADVWQLKTITKPSKAFWGFGFAHLPGWYATAYLDNIFMVF